MAEKDERIDMLYNEACACMNGAARAAGEAAYTGQAAPERAYGQKTSPGALEVPFTVSERSMRDKIVQDGDLELIDTSKQPGTERSQAGGADDGKGRKKRKRKKDRYSQADPGTAGRQDTGIMGLDDDDGGRQPWPAFTGDMWQEHDVANAFENVRPNNVQSCQYPGMTGTMPSRESINSASARPYGPAAVPGDRLLQGTGEPPRAYAPAGREPGTREASARGTEGIPSGQAGGTEGPGRETPREPVMAERPKAARPETARKASSGEGRAAARETRPGQARETESGASGGQDGERVRVRIYAPAEKEPGAREASGGEPRDKEAPGPGGTRPPAKGEDPGKAKPTSGAGEQAPAKKAKPHGQPAAGPGKNGGWSREDLVFLRDHMEEKGAGFCAMRLGKTQAECIAMYGRIEAARRKKAEAGQPAPDPEKAAGRPSESPGPAEPEFYDEEEPEAEDEDEEPRSPEAGVPGVPGVPPVPGGLPGAVSGNGYLQVLMGFNEKLIAIQAQIIKMNRDIIAHQDSINNEKSAVARLSDEYNGLLRQYKSLVEKVMVL